MKPSYLPDKLEESPKRVRNLPKEFQPQSSGHWQPARLLHSQPDAGASGADSLADPGPASGVTEVIMREGGPSQDLGPSWICPSKSAGMQLLTRHRLLDRDLALSRSAKDQPVVCGFLTSCRKDFTVRVQVIFRGHLLKLGTVKRRRA